MESEKGAAWKMMNGKTLVLIAVAAIITFALRAVPFVLFNDRRKMPDILVKLGQALPSAIMAVLIIYCLKDVGANLFTTGIPQIAAVAVVAVSYKWKHNTMLSIVMGTATNMCLIHFM